MKLVTLPQEDVVDFEDASNLVMVISFIFEHLFNLVYISEKMILMC